MITTIDAYNKALADVIEENRYLIQNIPATEQKKLPVCNQVFDLGKPIHMLITDNTPDVMPAVVDRGAYYEHEYPFFGLGVKNYTNNFGWVNDSDSIFFIERPFNNRVIKVLKRLLPNEAIFFANNDIIVGGYKIGPTTIPGKIDRVNLEENKKHNSGVIYLLRWTNVAGLDKYFAGDPNHELRKATKLPLGSLDMFLPKNVTRADFIKLLEEED